MGFGMPGKEALEEAMRKQSESEREYNAEGTLIKVSFDHKGYKVTVEGERLKNIQERINEVKMDLK